MARARPPTSSEHGVRTWLLAWFGGVVIGIVNGIVREKVYARRVGEATAHRVSSATAMLADYDLRRGRLWPLVLAWIGIGPAVTRTMRRRQVGARSGKCSK